MQLSIPDDQPILVGKPPVPEHKLGLTPEDTEAILQLITANAVCGAVAPTGSGKSTLLVEGIAAAGASIFVVEPTIPAVDSLCAYVGKKLPKGKVGSAAEGNVRYTNSMLNAMRAGKSPEGLNVETSIVYCTSGHVRRLFFDIIKYGMKVGMKDANLAFCDVLMLDEAHSGSLDLDVIMALWKFALEHGARVPHLLLASATLVMSTTPFPTAPFHEIKVFSHKVTVQYHTKDFQFDARDLYSETAKVVLTRHKADQSYASASATTGSAWLVFCAGSNEVEVVCDALQMARDPTLMVLRAYSTIDSAEMKKIFDPVPVGFRCIIVSTNIAETSITIDGLSGIFDTMTEKYGETAGADMSGGFRLSLGNISKSSAKQRLGRTGRTCEGFCYRMCTEGFFLRLQDKRPNEILRVPLHGTIMEIMEAGLDPMEILAGSLTLARLKNSINMLAMLGMVRQSQWTSVTSVTDMGRFAPKFPLSVRGSALLFLWLSTGSPLFPAVSIICLIECFGPSYYYYPRKAPNMTISDYDAIIETHYDTHFAQYDSPSDVEALIKMWLKLINTFKGANVPPHKLSAYCAKNSLNNKKIGELINNVRQVSNTLVKLGHQVVPAPFTPEGALQVLTPLMKSVYSDQILFLHRKTFGGIAYTNNRTGDQYKLEKRNRIIMEPTEAPEIIALVTAEIQSRKGAIPSRYVSLCFPLRSSSLFISTSSSGMANQLDRIQDGRRASEAPRMSTPTKDSGYRRAGYVSPPILRMYDPEVVYPTFAIPGYTPTSAAEPLPLPDSDVFAQVPIPASPQRSAPSAALPSGTQ